MAFRAQNGGYYKFNVSTSGTDISEYAISTITEISVTVIGLNQEPPTPTVTSTTFTSAGRFIDIIFSGKTNRGSITGGSFPCSVLLAFTGAELASCKWNEEANRISAYPSAVATDILIGANIAVLGNRIKAFCTALATSIDPTCSSWNYSNAGNHTLAAPSRPVLPTVAIAAPDVIGGCDDLPFDLSSSGGNARRQWASISYTVVSSTATSMESHELAKWLTNNYTFNPPTPHSQEYVLTRAPL